MIEKKIHLGDLFVVYGPLLTDKQQEILTLNLDEDYSLGEIAELLSISRQAVNDVVKKAEKAMELYEAKLNIIHKSELQKNLLDKARTVLEKHLSPDDGLYIELGQIFESVQDV